MSFYEQIDLSILLRVHQTLLPIGKKAVLYSALAMFQKRKTDFLLLRRTLHIVSAVLFWAHLTEQEEYFLFPQ
jgi:predicted nucleic-acid-binding protein